MTISLALNSTASTVEEQREALSAPVGDPAWFLARQWQTGAFIAADSGTPVHVTMAHTVGSVAMSGNALNGPVEPNIEAEQLPTMDMLDTATRVHLSSELVRKLRDAGVPPTKLGPLTANWASAFRLTPAQPTSWLASFTGRLFDPAGVYHLLANTLSPDGTTGTFPTLPGVDTSDRTTASAVESACRGWYAWVVSTRVARTTAASTLDPVAWDRQRLEYAFTANAGIAAGNVSLQAAGYDGNGVDWYTFDRGPATAGPDATTARSVEVHPVPLTYPGMPRPRFWEFEDGDVNLDALRSSADPARAVLGTFAHEYANDWFLVPLEIPPGACMLTELKVVDTFGTVTVVPAVAHVDGDAGAWKLWELTSTTGAADAATALRIFLPPSPSPLAGPVLEEILVARDELANLAWIIELMTRDGDGSRVDRYQRWLRLRPASDPAFNPSASVPMDGRAPATRYLLGTTIPDFWYPLLATTVNNQRVLTLASVPPEATGVPDDGVRGHLIAHSAGMSVVEEEATREGQRISRQHRLTLGRTGAVAWTARTKGPGEGESSSGLRFDVVES